MRYMIVAMDTITRDFIADIDTFMAQHGMTDRSFGVKCCNNPMFVFRLRDGTEPRLSTISKVRDWMRSYECKSEGESDAA